ncbi:MAG TPA: riboflavin synthase [Candidatus Angelobacter sp.]|nr:riboflavin synthase [Candidatus Angelobacter sp.]
MFTGLIQETGTITDLRRLAGKNAAARTRISVSAKSIPSELKTGDSVAVSGVCLTAVEIGSGKFSADLAEETLERTSLGQLKAGSLVNLELPAQAQARLGGHIVQGHVDGVAELVSLHKIAGGEDWRLVIDVPASLTKYIVTQGSIAVEGISLTVAKIAGTRVEIAIIPHSYQATNLRTLGAGDPLNIEVDVLAKYAEKIAQGTAPCKLTVDDLIKQGF